MEISEIRNKVEAAKVKKLQASGRSLLTLVKIWNKSLLDLIT